MPLNVNGYMPQLKAFLKSDSNTLHQAIVNAPFLDKVMSTQLDLGIVVLLLVNTKKKTIDRIALSETEQADRAVQMTAKPFKSIHIPLTAEQNIIAEAIRTAHFQQTDDWYYLFTPEFTAEQARFNQAGAGIESSVVYPLSTSPGGALIFSLHQPLQNVTETHHQFMEQYTALVSEALRLSKQ